MDLQQKLKEQGWYISTEGLNKLPPDVDKCDTRKVVQSLLDIDLRDVGAGALPTEISRKEDSIAGRIVLQILKIRNIAAPKANEESKVAPRFLYLELTDGVTQVFALEIENISSISLNTPPGTKLYLRSERIPLMQCMLTLRPSDVQVLGGEVVALVEKWELTRTLQKYARGGRMNTGSSGPPPWIPFGQKIQQFNDDKNFKSLGAGSAPEKEKDAKENEFDAMRNEAIAEAAKSGAKKVFGGGNQQMMDHNVKKIVEKGFSEMEAKNALKATRNNLERALYNLKRRDEGRESSEIKEVRGTSKMRPFEKSKRSIGKEEKPRDTLPTKPADVSLFDFLTDKLPTNTESTTGTSTSITTSTAAATTNSTSSANKYERHTSRYDSSKSQNSSSNHHHQQEYSGNSYKSQNSIPNDQQSSSNSQQQTNSNKGMKFENNISSSFANRNTNSNYGGDFSEGNSYRNRGRNERGERSSRGGGGGGGGPGSYSTRQQDMGRSGGSNYNNNHSNQGYNSNRNQTRPSQERERGPNTQQQQPTYGDNRTNGQRAGNDNRSYKTTSSARYPNKPNQPNYTNQNNSNSNRNYSENRNSYQSDSNKIKELIEDTAKMKIDHRPSNRGGASNRGQRSHSNVQQQVQSHQKPMTQHQSSTNQQHQQSHQQHHQQQQQSQQQQQQQHMPVTQQPQMQHPSQQPQPHAVYTQLPNGFAYDHNKIRGFQNKESNEYALSMLKTQTLPPQAATIPQPPSNAHPQYPQPPPPMPIPSPQQVFPGPPQFIMQPPQHVRAFGLPTIEGCVFNWKIGDRCLAKYWDDGRYYEAEITGLSDKTCVVLFLGYGNYEEVLKSDCLPINTNPTIMAHQPAAVPPQPQPIQQGVHPVHSQTNSRNAAANAASAAASSRYRGERQMYVPPPKREA